MGKEERPSGLITTSQHEGQRCSEIWPYYMVQTSRDGDHDDPLGNVFDDDLGEVREVLHSVQWVH